MIELVVLAGAVAGAVAYVRRARAPAPPRAADWMRVAKDAGMTHVAVGSESRLGGRAGDLGVRVELFAQGGAVAARVSVTGLANEIGLERRGLGERMLEAVGLGDLAVGDPDFDAALVVRSPRPLVARALLHAETRARVREVFDAGYPVTVAGRTLQATLSRALGAPGRFDADTLRTLFRLAQRLQPVEQAETRLARIARTDPLASVRAVALGALLADAPRHPATREAVRSGLADADPSVRLRAARAAGTEGVPALLALALAEDTEDGIAADAIAALGARFPVDAAAAAVARAAAGARVRTGSAAAAVLADAGGPMAERALVGALSGSDAAVAAAAAAALGRCGTAAAIPFLRDAEGRGADVRRAAREAVSAIQSRLTGATPGQVSLADGDAGRVALADDASGRVSPAEEDGR